VFAGGAATGIVGNEKMETAWAAGARLGYLVAPNVLSYVNAGYTGTYWKGTTLLGSATGTPSGLHTDKFNTGGAFVGGGVENNLNIFGISAPGWFMKTEYRAAYLDSKRLAERIDGGNALFGRDITFKPFVQTISTSLVYRFNWGGGPVVAKY
jgi:outer membrane immunogenic protein